MSRRSLTLISGLAALMLASLACTISLPGTVSTDGAAATAVAGTIAALTPASPTTAEAHSAATEAAPLPTLAPAPIRVSFINSARNLYVWTDGTAAAVQLTSSGDAVQSYVSPDGSLIAFTRSTDFITTQLDVINFNGTNQRTLVTSAAFAALPRDSGTITSLPYKIAWIPNSHRLAMNVRLAFEGPGLQVADQLYNIDVDSGVMTTLLATGASGQFSYSPDGSKIVITRSTGIDLYHADSSLLLANVVVHSFVNTASEYAWVATPSWQPDSSYFAVAIPPAEPWVDSPAPSSVWKVSSTGTALTTLTTGMSFFPGSVASFDPILSRVAFATRVGPAADNIWALHIANIDGSSDSILANGYFSHLPTWAPDGNYYLFSNMSGSVSQAYLGSSTSAPVLLADVASLQAVRWLDNHRYVVSSKGPAGTSLLLGTIGSTSGVIFNDPGPFNSQELNFDVNR